MRRRLRVTRADGQPVKWDYLWPAEMVRLARLPFEQSTPDGTAPGQCSGCSEVIGTEAAFAMHFVIPDARYLNLGYCPNRDKCAACGGPMHRPTWGCVRPTGDGSAT